MQTNRRFCNRNGSVHRTENQNVNDSNRMMITLGQWFQTFFYSLPSLSIFKNLTSPLHVSWLKLRSGVEEFFLPGLRTTTLGSTQWYIFVDGETRPICTTLASHTVDTLGFRRKFAYVCNKTTHWMSYLSFIINGNINNIITLVQGWF